MNCTNVSVEASRFGILVRCSITMHVMFSDIAIQLPEVKRLTTWFKTVVLK